ncbi:MAG: hypothetical protein IJQ12_10595 [Lachnospiraceae bacterium]|nr:hypothetical protein [Lachnospiraceae bacterium]
MNENIAMIIIMAGVLIGAGPVIAAAYLAEKESGEGILDERQRVQRGKAWRDTCIAMMIFSAVLLLTETTEVFLTMSKGVAPYLIFAAGIGTFTADSMFRGAYMGYKGKGQPVWSVLAHFAVYGLGAFLHSAGKELQIAGLTVRHFEVLGICIFFVPTIIAMVVRTRMDKKEEADDADETGDEA